MLRPIRLKKVLRIAALVLVGAWALYLVGMNVFVRTRLFRNLISEDPGSILVDYSSAYSLVPGWIHVEDLRIRGRDSNVEWILALDRCDFRFAVLDFTHRRFHAEHVHGDGLSLRVRQREPSFTAEEAAALPPVPGFSDPPLAGPPPLTDANYNLWSIWLESVVADHVREIWIDTLRSSGDMQIRGRWFFRPMRWLDVGPATVDARRLDVSYGLAESWVSETAGHLNVTVHPFDVRAFKGADILHQVSVAGELHGAAHVAAMAQHGLRGAPLTVVQGESSFQTDMRIDHGVLQPATRAHLDRFVARASGWGLDLGGSVEVSLDVSDGDVGEARVDLEGLTAVQGSDRVTATRIGGVLHSHELDLAHPFTDASFVADAAEVHAASLKSWYRRLPLPPKLTVDSEDVTVNAHVAGSLPERTLEGRVQAVVHALDVSIGAGRLSSDVSGTVHVAASLEQHHVDLSGSELLLENARGQVMGVTVSAHRIGLRASRVVVTPPGVLGRLTIDVSEMNVPHLVSVVALVPLPSGVTVEGGAARAEAHLDVDLGEGAVEGSARLVAHDLAVRVGGAQAMRGELSVLLTAKQRGPRTDVSGSSMQLRPEGKDGWWARVDLPEASMSLRGGARLDAHVLVHAQDASPITALLASHADVAAKLAIGAISTSDLHVSGEIIAGPSAVEARSFVARANGLGMDFEMAKLGQDRIGAAFVVVGPVRAGVDLHNGSTSVMLVGAEPWFVATTAALRARERAYE